MLVCLRHFGAAISVDFWVYLTALNICFGCLVHAMSGHDGCSRMPFICALALGPFGLHFGLSAYSPFWTLFGLCVGMD